MEQDYNANMCCEPGTAPALATDESENWVDPEIPYEVDFGYPRTVEELIAALEKAHSQINDPSKWITHEKFMDRLKQDFKWL